MNLQKVTAVQDNDCHWYVIPSGMVADFHRLLDGGDDTEDEFIDTFDEYRTGGDLNNIQLYAEL